MGDPFLGCPGGGASSISLFLQNRIPQAYNLTVNTVLIVLFCPVIIAIVLIFISLWILSKLLQKAFKALLLQFDDKSFQLSVLVLTTLVGYYQIPRIPFFVYTSFFSFLVALKWLQGSECGILKDKVCYVIFRLNQEWIFRNLSVLGIKLHGCHPVTKCVFESGNFLFHEGTEINPEILWDDLGVWNPPAVPLVWDPKRKVLVCDESFRTLMSDNLIEIDFPVKKGPLDFGYGHVYRVQLKYKNDLLRYSVDYVELKNDNKHHWRGGTDDFHIEMNEVQISKFYQYIRLLEGGTALISVMDDMCHCEKMIAVAKLIKKGEKFYEGSFTEKDRASKKRVFCGVNGFKSTFKVYKTIK